MNYSTFHKLVYRYGRLMAYKIVTVEDYQNWTDMYQDFISDAESYLFELLNSQDAACLSNIKDAPEMLYTYEIKTISDIICNLGTFLATIDIALDLSQDQ